jgi:hypothetical protein
MPCLYTALIMSHARQPKLRPPEYLTNLGFELLLLLSNSLFQTEIPIEQFMHYFKFSAV